MKIIQFPRWAEVLGASDLPQKDRESYRVTLRWYLGWCHRHGVGCSFESARNFIEWAQEEKQANDWMVERWREPIRWFFRGAKAQVQGSCAEGSGVPQSCTVGSEAWEARRAAAERAEEEGSAIVATARGRVKDFVSRGSLN